MNTIISFLAENKMLYEVSGNQIFTKCPRCDKDDASLNPVSSFLIYSDTGYGECKKCQLNVSQNEWQDMVSPKNKIETGKPLKTRQYKKRPDESKTTVPSEPIPAVRVIKIDTPFVETSFESWKRAIKINFPDLVFPAEVAASVVAQILITEITNPFALVLVGAPSSGKTITINFFDDIEGITYATDKFTPASFISNASNVKKEDLSDIDLLPRIRYKAMLIRDLATIFSKSEDSLNEALGLLTRVLDGQGLSTDSGTHGRRQYSGDYLFMMLAASTPIRPHVWKIMGSIGSRLFFLDMGTSEKSEEELVKQLITSSTKNMEKACKDMTKNFLYTLWSKNPNGIEWKKGDDDLHCIQIITRCAKLLARLRGVIHVREKTTGSSEVSYEYHPATKEFPDRITQLFYNLCRGHAVISGRKQISSDDLRLIIELTISSAPITRANLLRGLLLKNGHMKTREVKAYLGCETPTALKEMETLRILGIATITKESNGHVGEPEKKIHLSEDLEWFLSDECRAIRGLPPIPA